EVIAGAACPDALPVDAVLDRPMGDQEEGDAAPTLGKDHGSLRKGALLQHACEVRDLVVRQASEKPDLPEKLWRSRHEARAYRPSGVRAIPGSGPRRELGRSDEVTGRCLSCRTAVWSGCTVRFFRDGSSPTSLLSPASSRWAQRWRSDCLRAASSPPTASPSGGLLRP